MNAGGAKARSLLYMEAMKSKVRQESSLSFRGEQDPAGLPAEPEAKQEAVIDALKKAAAAGGADGGGDGGPPVSEKWKGVASIVNPLQEQGQ